MAGRGLRSIFAMLAIVSVGKKPPAPEGSRPKRAWWTVLNYLENPDDREDLFVDEVKARFATLAKKRHPDMQGGNADAFNELIEARDDAIKSLGGESWRLQQNRLRWCIGTEARSSCFPSIALAPTRHPSFMTT